MARLGGVVERTYIRYEHGERKPLPRFLDSIAKHGVNIKFILDEYAEHSSGNDLAKRLIKERNRLQLDQETVAKVEGSLLNNMVNLKKEHIILIHSFY